MSRGTTSVGISDPTGYPYAIVSRTAGSPTDSGFELHLIDGPATLEDWQQLVVELQASGDYEEVALTTMNFHEHESGRSLGR